jgi:hypothetical protein
MKQVAADEFFAALNADPRDIMPTIVSGWPYTSEWRNQKSQQRELFGKTVDSETDEKTYWLA